MANQLFFDGFDAYGTDQIPLHWGGTDLANQAISAGAGRRGGQALYTSAGPSSDTLIQYFAPSQYVALGFAVKMVSATETILAAFYYGSTRHAVLRMNADRTISLLRDTTVLATSTNTLTLDAYAHIQIGLKIADSGTWDIRVNSSGTGWIGIGTGDTLNGGTALVDSLRLVETAAAAQSRRYYDDIWLTFGDSVELIGDCRADVMELNANSTPQDWTPDTGTSYTRLNQETGYISSSTPGAISFFGAADLPYTPSVIVAAQTVWHADKASANLPGGVVPLIKSSSTTAALGAIMLTNAENGYRNTLRTDPATGAAWTVSGVNAILPGIECVPHRLMVTGYGSNDSVPSTLDALAHTPTYVGNARIRTDQYKWAAYGSSLYFDGSGDSVTFADSADFELGSNNFFIRGWVRFAGYPTYNGGSYFSGLFSKDVSASRSWYFSATGTASSLTGFSFYGIDSGGGSTTVSGSNSMSLNTWYYIEVSRSGNNIYLFADGVLLNTGGTAFSRTLNNATAALRLGAMEFDGTFTGYLNGYMQDVELVIGIPGHIANYRVPEAELLTP